MFTIDKLDHLVLTVKSIEKTVEFYQNILGMKREVFGDERIALKFGDQKINLHEVGNEFEPKADLPMPGSGDLCLITQTPMAEVVKHFQKAGIEIDEGPVQRTGANGKLISVYIRDPDLNLIEVSNYM